jgi:hypothetical protein
MPLMPAHACPVVCSGTYELKQFFHISLVIMDILGAIEADRVSGVLIGDSIFCIVICFKAWASGLGIGFWLRGVQPRTTVG